MNCPKCGAPAASSFSFCEHCGSPLESQQAAAQQPALEQPAYNQPAYDQPLDQQPVSQQTAKPEKPENVVTGTVGALLGALIGAAAIILVSQLGYVAGICGVILAVCTLKGYELLGGKLSTKGIIIGIVIMLVTPYIADRMDWAIMLLKETSGSGATFAEAFAKVPGLITEDGIELGDYWFSVEPSDYYINLAMLYGFTLLGGFSTVFGAIKKK